MKTNFAAIIFDMDGLLVDSEPVWHIAEVEIVESRGHKYTDDVREQMVGLRMDEFLTKLHRIYNFSDSIESLYAELTKHMLRLIPQKVKAQPGASELVAYVAAQNNILSAIASSSPMSIIDITLKSRKWDNIFTYRFSADDDTHGKPDPDVYLRTAKSLGVNSADCLALEDSPNGARAAVAAGMTCYAVPDLSHSEAAAFDGITEHVFASLHDVLHILQHKRKQENNE